MNDNVSIKIFEGKSIRTIRDEKQNKLFYSVVDIVDALTESQNPNVFWRVLKKRLLEGKNETVTICNGLKLLASDGKMRMTDVVDNEQLIRLVQYISSSKTESFLHWLGHFNQSEIENRIYTIRSVQVMIDSDLAEMYGVDTKRLNEQVKRNNRRFPDQFLFQISETEKNKLVANCDQFSNLKHSSVLPFAFTEQGVAMLSAVLHSDTAINVSIKIIQAFVEMRKIIQNSSSLYHRMHRIELKQNETDDKIEKIFKALESKNEIPEKGIFLMDKYSIHGNLFQILSDQQNQE